MATRARKAVDKAAKACDRAYEALRELTEFTPDSTVDRHLVWLKDLREYTEYLESCRWPDRMD